MASSLRFTGVLLAEVQLALLDFLVEASPTVTRSDLIRLAIESFVLTHPNWDPARFAAFAERYAKKHAKKLQGDTKKLFQRDVVRVTQERDWVEGAALPLADSLDFESDAGDFDL